MAGPPSLSGDPVLGIGPPAAFLRVQVGEIADRAPVGVLDDVLKVVIGLLLRGAADDSHRRPHLDVAAVLTGKAFGLGDTWGAGFGCLDCVEMHVRVADREPAARLGAAGVHHQRVPIAEGTRCPLDAVETVVGSVVIEAGLSGPDPLDDGPPFFALGVAGVVLLLGPAEPVELVLVPAADDVHAEAPAADVIAGGHLLGRDERVMQGNMNRAEHVQTPGGRQEAAGPGDRLEAGSVGVGLAPVALPARDGHHALDPDRVRHLRQLEIVLPAGVPALGKRGVGSPARAIGAEEPEAKSIAVHQSSGPAFSHRPGGRGPYPARAGSTTLGFRPSFIRNRTRIPTMYVPLST